MCAGRHKVLEASAEFYEVVWGCYDLIGKLSVGPESFHEIAPAASCEC